MKRSLPLLALAVIAGFALELFALQWMKPLENRLLDSFVKTHASALTPDPDIVMIDIDEKSLAEMEKDAGRWPWPRVVYADLIEGLAAQKPRAIVFDMMFVEKDHFRPQDDAAFAESAARHANTYFAFLRLPEANDSRGIRIGDFASDFALIRSKRADPEAKVALVPPLVLPKETHSRAGLITFKEDRDGVGRRYLLRETVGGWQIPSLPARVALDLGFPVPDADDLVLAWRGGAKSFPRVSFSDLYEEFGRSVKTRRPTEFSGKIVVIGTAATGLHDLRVTPMGSLHPGAEIVGTAIENLKNGRQMRYAPEWWAAAVGVALLVALYLAFHRGVDLRVTGAALAVLTALLIGAQWILVGRLTLWPLLTPLTAAWTFYAAAGLAEHLRTRREKQQAVAQFSRFTNPHVARQLVERGGI
ncbi:MAG TPA: CHASE2 domain-containing protein, partial [Burkholderiales bacterium]|nr:CHASE2 domain-containing protein [Burkholderiales bacterium]